MEIQRESVFISALRTFCRVFFGIVAVFLAIFLISSLYTLLSSTTNIQEKTTITYLPDANGVRDGISLTSPVILQINIHGVIGEPKVLDTNTVQDILTDSRAGVLKGDRVKGILLHLNTPGGTVVDSDNIYRMLMDYKKRYKVPVYAYIDGLCASGGVYVSCAADQIYAGNSSIIGSVGVVIGPFLNIYETLNKIGVSSRTLTQGLDKDMMNPLRPWKEGEDDSLKAVTAYYYQQFVGLVSSSRPRMDKEKLINQYGAQIFDPVKAQEYGYVDFINSSRDETLLALLHAANLDASKPYLVVELETKSVWLSALTSQSPLFTGKVEHTLDLGQPKIRDRVAYLYQPFEK